MVKWNDQNWSIFVSSVHGETFTEQLIEEETLIKEPIYWHLKVFSSFLL